jgi:hypothetical protein
VVELLKGYLLFCDDFDGFERVLCEQRDPLSPHIGFHDNTFGVVLEKLLAVLLHLDGHVADIPQSDII